MKKLIFQLFLLLFGLGQGIAQSLGIPVTNSEGQSIAENGFKVGTLTIKANFSSSATQALITVTFPQGMQYDGGLTSVSGLSVQEHDVSDTRRPVFKITGISGVSEATFSIAKKVTPQIMQSINVGLKDEVAMSVDGNAVAPTHTAPYILKYPVLAIEGENTVAVPTHNNASGTSSQKFKIKNTGDGAVKEVYFAVQYPLGVTGNSLSYEGTSLSPVGTFTPDGGSPINLYKVSISAGLPRNASILIMENYTVTGCAANRQNKYFAMWGSSQNQNDFYQIITNTRTLNIEQGTPNITLLTGGKSYFKWLDGLGGNYLGEYNVTFANNGSGNATAYNVVFNHREYSWIAFDNHEISDLRIVATDGTEIPIPIPTTPLPEKNEANNPAFRTRAIPFNDIPQLSVASLAGKDIGLSDVDGDGYADDWSRNKEIKLRFKLKKVRDIGCLERDERGQFSVMPLSLFNYVDACGVQRTTPELNVRGNVFQRTFYGISDSSKLPDVLSLGQQRPAYLSFGNHSYGAGEREQGQAWKDNPVAYRYVVKLPPNLSMKNVRLVKKPHYAYEDAQNPAIKVDLPDVPVGGTFSHTFTSTPWEKGYIAFDLKLESCTGNSSGKVEYSIYHIDSYGKSHEYPVEFVCSEKQIAYDCPDTTCSDAPRMKVTKTERAENSYGWKDWTMNERMQRSDYTSELELSRALYLDDIEVTAEGVAQGNFDDLYYHWEVKKGTRLVPKSFKFTITRAGAEIVNQTLQANGTFPIKSTSDWINQNTQFLWNLTPYLPADKMKDGDEFKVIATYQLTSGAGSTKTAYDVQSSNESYFYTDATNKKYCGVKQIPTFYVAGTYELLGTNAYRIKGCEETAIGANQVYMARRSTTSGTYFSQEFRPGRLIKDIKLTYPSSYKVVKIEYEFRQKDAHVVSGYKDITSYFSSTDDGTNKVYTFTNPTDRNNPRHLNAGEISVENDYNATLRATLQASCGSKTDDTERAVAEINYYDFHYHYEANGGEEVEKKILWSPLLYTEKPGVALTSVSPLTLRVNTKQQEVEVELSNSSLTAAPYTWLSIPDVQGVKVLELIDSDTNTPIARQTGITGEAMYFLSDTGLAKGAKKKYKIKFEMTNCVNTSFDVYAGWNCSEYPTRGYQHTCNENKITYALNVVQSRIQITPESTNPGVGSNPNTIAMCEKTEYKYIINSAGEGNIENPKVVIVKESGLEISDFVVNYPYGSANNHAVAPTINGNLITYDLSAVVAAGNLLPGSMAQSEENKRRVGVVFKVKPSCDFVSGSSFDVDMTGLDICGNEVEGDKNTVITAGIQGILSNEYSVNNTLTLKSGNANYCVGSSLSPQSFAKYEGKHVINKETGSTSFVATQAGGEVIVRIPKGFEYVPNTFTPTGKTPGATFSDPALASTPITSVGNGETELHIMIPAGMQDTHFFTYTIEVRQKPDAVLENCTETQKLKYYTTDKVSGVMCGTSNCGEITVETSRLRGQIAIPMERVTLQLTDIQLSSEVENGKEKVTITYKVQNTSAALNYSGNLVVSLFDDADNSGSVTVSEKLQDFTLTNLNISANTSVQQNHQISLPENQLCRLYLAIRSESNPCLCNDDLQRAVAPTQIVGLISDVKVCERESKALEYNSQAPNYESYRWSAVTPGALAYLSDVNIKNPIFSYTGPSLTAETTYVYTLTVKRTNACETSQQMSVTVSPAPNAPSVTNQSLCPSTGAANFVATPTAGHTLRWYDTVTSTTFETNTPSISLNVTTKTIITKYVSQANAQGCESDKVPVTITIDDTQAPVIDNLADLTISCQATDIDNQANNWLSSVNVTDACGLIANTTNDYATVKPTDWCNVLGNTVTVTITSTDTFGNTATKTAFIRLVAIDAVDDDFGIVEANTTTTGSILDNDKLGTASTTTANVEIQNVVSPHTGITISTTDGKVSVANNVPSGVYTLTYTICEKVKGTPCDDATVTVTVENSIVADNDNLGTVVSGGTTTQTVISNDKFNGTPVVIGTGVGQVTLTPLITPTGITIDATNGKVTVGTNVSSGVYTLTYKICENGATPDNCDEAT
ncbi:hypothetical protein ACILPE_07105, partial [Capnocytophaga canimorsus]|uniref:Ig-like domain-containing protein n=1 Tax=Capnocytophaga canimorsus TaxID=28188 RepID=UPI0037D3979D